LKPTQRHQSAALQVAIAVGTVRRNARDAGEDAVIDALSVRIAVPDAGCANEHATVASDIADAGAFDGAEIGSVVTRTLGHGTARTARTGCAACAARAARGTRAANASTRNPLAAAADGGRGVVTAAEQAEREDEKPFHGDEIEP